MTGIAPYRSEADIEEVVRRFEECDYTPEEFVHARHLTVAAWYFLREDAETAEERMRAGLRKFIRHHGKNGYHATITGFWLRMVEREVRGARGDGDGDRVSLVNAIVGRLGDKDLIWRYYTRERVGSAEAKAEWMEPDVKDLLEQGKLGQAHSKKIRWGRVRR